jgi:hypothetical protein
MVVEGGFLLLTKERFCGIIFIDKKDMELNINGLGRF